MKNSKYVYGGHQWLEEHLGFDEENNHIGGVDLYMPIVEKSKIDIIKTFQTVEPMWVASFQASGIDAIEVARNYFFQWAEEAHLFEDEQEHRFFAYYNHEKIGTEEFFYRINVTVDKSFCTNNDKIECSEFPGGYYVVMKSKYKYNEWAWNNVIQWVKDSSEYTFGDTWFFEEYLINEPKIHKDTELFLYMPVKKCEKKF